jgi:hypothetical protein
LAHLDVDPELVVGPDFFPDLVIMPNDSQIFNQIADLKKRTQRWDSAVAVCHLGRLRDNHLFTSHKEYQGPWYDFMGISIV